MRLRIGLMLFYNLYLFKCVQLCINEASQAEAKTRDVLGFEKLSDNSFSFLSPPSQT